MAKHLYDITILSETDIIKDLLQNKSELNKLISFKRAEEKVRAGGIDDNLEIKDFTYFKLEFNDELINTFNRM